MSGEFLKGTGSYQQKRFKAWDGLQAREILPLLIEDVGWGACGKEYRQPLVKSASQMTANEEMKTLVLQ